ncbi:MAG: hypothetical protein JOS17DRAFT_357373 [Linnemannia elongata]|nr:MAG: hypothetical protein JOS17DRAFT_357373 [Linnemannia elongata]
MPASDDLPSYQFTPVSQRVQPEQRANVTYELILRQQPKQSRMCGVGEKERDRRRHPKYDCQGDNRPSSSFHTSVRQSRCREFHITFSSILVDVSMCSVSFYQIIDLYLICVGY